MWESKRERRALARLDFQYPEFDKEEHTLHTARPRSIYPLRLDRAPCKKGITVVKS